MDMERRKSVRFVLPPDTKIEYKNIALLEKFVTNSGKIVSRRITGLDGKRNRELAMAVKWARYLGLLNTGGHKH